MSKFYDNPLAIFKAVVHCYIPEVKDLPIHSIIDVAFEKGDLIVVIDIVSTLNYKVSLDKAIILNPYIAYFKIKRINLTAFFSYLLRLIIEGNYNRLPIENKKILIEHINLLYLNNKCSLDFVQKIQAGLFPSDDLFEKFKAVLNITFEVNEIYTKIDITELEFNRLKYRPKLPLDDELSE